MLNKTGLDKKGKKKFELVKGLPNSLSNRSPVKRKKRDTIFYKKYDRGEMYIIYENSELPETFCKFSSYETLSDIKLDLYLFCDKVLNLKTRYILEKKGFVEKNQIDRSALCF